MSTKPSQPDFDVGYDGHRRRQVRLGLEMTPAQRLEWLEGKLAEARRLLGAARGNSENSQLSVGARIKSRSDS